MLILGRKTGEQIRIGEDIVVTVVKVDRSYVKVGITAPAGTRNLRGELKPEQKEERDGVQ